MPDRYWWPSDEFEGRYHFHDHMVVAFARDEALHVLDTDALADDEFVRAIRITEALRRSCTRVGELVAPPPRPVRPGVEMAAALLPTSVNLLAEDIATLRRFHAEWDGRRLPYLVARGFHVAVLGDFQPVLFLLSQALAGPLPPQLVDIRAKAGEAAERAKRLGLLLLSLHRYESDLVYGLCRGALGLLLYELEALHGLICAAVGVDVSVSGATADFWARLIDITHWCFDPDGVITLETLAEVARPADGI
jgi:hypothetical protein